MCDIPTMIERLQQLQEDLIPIAGIAMEERKDEIVGLLIDQQYNENVDSEGNPLRDYFPTYKRIKQRLGKSGDTDFELTGEFHSTMNLLVDSGADEYEIYSPAETDEGELKSEWLTEWQESPVMSLTEQNQDIARELIFPEIIEKSKLILEVD